MIIIGLITVALIIPLYGNGSLRTSNLGATAYLGTDIVNTNLSFPGNSGTYIPNLNTNYQVSAFRTSNTQTITTTSSVPTTTQTYYYTTYDNQTTTSGDQGYVPPGCEGGTDYSTTTNEPCG